MGINPMQLYSYCKSSASYRVRIALNLKHLNYSLIPVNLLKNEQNSKEYRKKNPMGLVPALEVDGHILTQSLAILEWLDDNYPSPSIIPGDSYRKAQIRATAYMVACDIQPIQNLRVLKHLIAEYEVDQSGKEKWIKHWISMGFDAVERDIEAAPFCFGEHPSIADICLIPQTYNARRFNLDMDKYPKISRVVETCHQLEAFEKAKPENQPDMY